MANGTSRLKAWTGIPVQEKVELIVNELDELAAAQTGAMSRWDTEHRQLVGEVRERLARIERRSQLMLTIFVSILVAVLGNLGVLLITRS